MKAEYPPVQMMEKVKTMTAQEVNANFLGIFSALAINGASLWGGELKLEAVGRPAPKGMLEYTTALAKRADELGYDVIKKYEPVILGKNN